MNIILLLVLKIISLKYIINVIKCTYKKKYYIITLSSQNYYIISNKITLCLHLFLLWHWHYYS